MSIHENPWSHKEWYIEPFKKVFLIKYDANSMVPIKVENGSVAKHIVEAHNAWLMENEI